MQLQLNRSYNPIWFTDNELSQITPLPMAWDITASQRAGPAATAGSSPARTRTPAGARAVYRFLNAQAKKLSGYATSPIWSIVDGPWKLQSADQLRAGDVRAQPRSTTAPTSRSSRSSSSFRSPARRPSSRCCAPEPAKGDGGGSAPQISVGYVPDTDVPQAPALQIPGLPAERLLPLRLRLLRAELQQPGRRTDPAAALLPPGLPASRQPERLDPRLLRGPRRPDLQPGAGAAGEPVRRTRSARANPYPFSVTAATRILKAHGWKVVAERDHQLRAPRQRRAASAAPASQRGKQLRFTLMYPNGMSSTDGAMVDLQSVARQVGIQITLKEVTTATIDAEIEPCAPHTAACNWQLGQYGSAWVFAPDHYPTGEEIFQTRRARQRRQLLRPRDRQADQGDHDDLGAPARRRALDAYANAVRAAAARLLAALARER